ncbi:MAG: PHB depolymerase family esterase [Phycisphaerae bacterium]|nr:PHB depolymerase family esterase [Phycisphaerae bacterium]
MIRSTFLKAAAVLAMASSVFAAPEPKPVSFGLPEVKAVKETIIEGRKVIRYEHDSVSTWGYAVRQSDYYYLVHPKSKPKGKVALRVVLHSAGHSGDRVLADAFKHHDWTHYYGNDRSYVLFLDCRKNRGDWWWGYHTIKRGKNAYKTELCPTEKRVLSTVELVIGTHAIDRNRVYLSGISMGGSGSLGIGMCRGDVFAAISVAVPAGVEHMTHRMTGAKHPDPPPMVNCSSHIDGWARGQEDLLALCKKRKYPVIFAWGLFGHRSDVSAANTAVHEFPWLTIRRNEAYPVFTNASCNHKYPGFKNKTADDQKGQINGYFRWKNITDTHENFVMELRLVGKKELTKPIELPNEATADVTPRRLQKFAVAKSKKYKWRMTRGGKTSQSGEVAVGADGLLMIPKVKISPAAAQLSIEAAGPVRSTR